MFGLAKDFFHFINRGNVFELATAVIMAQLFQKIVESAIGDLITPLLGFILVAKLSENFIVIKRGEHYPYKNREEAIQDQAITLNIGNFIETSINFFTASFFIYLSTKTFIKIRNKLEHEPLIETVIDSH